MAHSIQIIGDQTMIFDDSDLIAIVGLLEDKIEGNISSYNAVRDWISKWQRSLRGYGCGTIDLNFEHLVTIPEVRSELAALLLSVRDDLRQSGDTMPASVLQGRCRAPGVTFFDYPIDALVIAIDRLMVLLDPPQNPQVSI